MQRHVRRFEKSCCVLPEPLYPTKAQDRDAIKDQGGGERGREKCCVTSSLENSFHQTTAPEQA